jgi:hypothetical protein
LRYIATLVVAVRNVATGSSRGGAQALYEVVAYPAAALALARLRHAALLAVAQLTIIRAEHRYRVVALASHGIAHVVGAGVSVVAILWYARAETLPASVPIGTQVAVVAEHVVGRVDATRDWETKIIGTKSVVVAVRRFARLAGARLAGVPQRTLATVIAGDTIGQHRITAETGSLVTTANVVALVAGRADNRV